MPRVERHAARTGRPPPEGLRPAESRGPPLLHAAQHSVLRLQRGIGNAAVARLLARSPGTTSAPADTAPAAAAPDFVEAAQWDKQGDADFKAGRFAKAAAAYAEAYRESPDAFFVYNQALAIERLGRAEEAADLYERYLVERGPADDTLRIKSHIHKLRGEPIPEGQDDDEPPITAKGKEGSTAWFDRGQSAFLAKRYVKAADCFRRAFELVPYSAFVYNEGSSLELGGHPAAAANAYEHYVILAPGADDADQVIGKIKALRGQAPPASKDSLLDPEEEQSAVPEVTATGAAGADEWFRRGAAAHEMGDFKRAYDCFVNAYDLQPSPAFVYNQAKSLDLLGNADAAVQAYERFLALDAKGGASLDVRAHQAVAPGVGGRECEAAALILIFRLGGSWIGTVASTYSWRLLPCSYVS